MTHHLYKCPTCDGQGWLETARDGECSQIVICNSSYGLSCHGDGEIELETEVAMAYGLVDGTTAACRLIEDGYGWDYVLDTLAEYGLEYDRRQAAE